MANKINKRSMIIGKVFIISLYKMIRNKLNQTEYLSLYNIMAANKQKETDSK